MDPSGPQPAAFSAVETRPWAEIQAMQMRKLEQQLAYLAEVCTKLWTE